MQVATFKIAKSPDGTFSVRDTCEFNNWGEWLGVASLAEAELRAQWAHAFKTGRTFSEFAAWKAAYAKG